MTASKHKKKKKTKQIGGMAYGQAKRMGRSKVRYGVPLRSHRRQLASSMAPSVYEGAKENREK